MLMEMCNRHANDKNVFCQIFDAQIDTIFWRFLYRLNFPLAGVTTMDFWSQHSTDLSHFFRAEPECSFARTTSPFRLSLPFFCALSPRSRVNQSELRGGRDKPGERENHSKEFALKVELCFLAWNSISGLEELCALEMRL